MRTSRDTSTIGRISRGRARKRYSRLEGEGETKKEKEANRPMAERKERERERRRDAAARVDGWFEGIWGFPESSRTREPTRAALHVALLVLISELDSPVALRRAPLVTRSLSLPHHIRAIGTRIFCLAVARCSTYLPRRRERGKEKEIYK